MPREHSSSEKLRYFLRCGIGSASVLNLELELKLPASKVAANAGKGARQLRALTHWCCCNADYKRGRRIAPTFTFVRLVAVPELAV
jgi:hypothetical protein